MRQPCTVVISLALAITACSDAAPRVDPEKPVVDGQPMTQIEYLGRFCRDKQADPMCVEVAQAMNRASTTAEVPKGW